MRQCLHWARRLDSTHRAALYLICAALSWPRKPPAGRWSAKTRFEALAGRPLLVNMVLEQASTASRG